MGKLIPGLTGGNRTESTSLIDGVRDPCGLGPAPPLPLLPPGPRTLSFSQKNARSKKSPIKTHNFQIEIEFVPFCDALDVEAAFGVCGLGSNGNPEAGPLGFPPGLPPTAVTPPELELPGPLPLPPVADVLLNRLSNPEGVVFADNR